MGHYSGEMGRAPDYAAEYEASEERKKTVMPLVEDAFLIELDLWPDPEGAHAHRDSLRLWKLVEDRVVAQLQNSDLFVDRSDIQQVFYALVRLGFISFTMRIALTRAGRAKVDSLKSSN